jgi:hypothetical protein
MDEFINLFIKKCNDKYILLEKLDKKNIIEPDNTA